MSRPVCLVLALIVFLPAFSQGREVLVDGDTIVSSVFEALDYVDFAYEDAPYEDNPLIDALSEVISYASVDSIAVPEAVLDLIIGAYGAEVELFQHRITSGFGYREEFGKVHHGIDIAMNVGTNVCVPFGGVVRRVGYDSNGYGLYVIVSHADGIETRYAHLKSALVRPGQAVKAGAIVASSGCTGNSTAPHLHFEVRRNGMPINPVHFFNIDK